MPEAVNREHWLNKAVDIMRPWFDEYETVVDMRTEPIHVSCGWTKGRTDMAIGQCWYKGACADESKAVHNIFICPTQDEPLRVLDILLHELIHVAAGPEAGHRGMFRWIALDLGLEGKMTATFVSDDNPLRAKLQLIIEQIGEYPHTSLRKPEKKAAQKGKWVRLVSVKEPTYTLVISPKSIEEVGYPRDPWNIMMVPK